MLNRRLKLRFAFALLPLGVVLLLFSIWHLFRAPAEIPAQLKMTAGSFDKTRHLVARRFADDAGEHRLTLEMIESAGSVEALDLVDRGAIEVALIQGGIRLGDRPNVRQLTAVAIEPLHLLVKQELYEAVSEDLSALANKRVAVSPPGSGTHLLTLEILEFAGLSPRRPDSAEGDFIPVMDSYSELLALLQTISVTPSNERRQRITELPDAVFVVSIAPSRVAKGLVSLGGFRLVQLRFGKAFSLSTVGAQVRPTNEGLSRLHISTTEIPAFTYDVTPPVPPTTCETLGTRLLLVAHKDVDPAVARRLLRVLYEGPLDKLIRPPRLADLLPEYPLHEGAIQYRDRDKPLIRGEIVEYFQKILSVFGPAIGGLLALYGFFRWRQTLKFQWYFQEICRIHQIARGSVADPQAPFATKARMEYLDGRLDELQLQAVDAFTNQYFYGEGVMETLLALLAEVRISVRNRLIEIPADAADNSR